MKPLNPPAAVMTLRDAFAGLAMQAIVSALEHSDKPAHPDAVAAAAYEMADAMLKAREA